MIISKVEYLNSSQCTGDTKIWTCLGDLALRVWTVNGPHAKPMQHRVDVWDQQGQVWIFSLSLFLSISIFSFLSPLISQCVRWRQGLWGTVYDIRLCNSDSMMLIICLQATRNEGERGEREIERWRDIGSRTERRWTGNEQDGRGEGGESEWEGMQRRAESKRERERGHEHLKQTDAGMWG